MRESNIDMARGVSILAVLAYHFSLYPPVSDHGRFGVVLFFFISGYCMQISLAASPGALEFVIRRWSRLVPALVVCALATHLLETSFSASPDRLQTWFDVFKNFACIPTIDVPCGAVELGLHKYGRYIMVDGAYWSLRVEFKFYALLAVLYFGLSKRWHVAGLLTVAALGGLLQTLRTTPAYLSDFVPYLPCFAFGASVFEIRHGKPRFGALLLVASVLLAVAFAMGGVSGYSIPILTGNLWAYFVCAALILAFATLPQVRSTPAKVLAGLGLVSYPVYLLHQDIGLVLRPVFEAFAGRVLTVWVLLPVTFVSAAYVVHHTVEYRLERRAKAWFKASASPPVPHQDQAAVCYGTLLPASQALRRY